MKAPLLALLIPLLAITPTAMAQSPKEVAAEAKIKKALERIVIPKLEFHEATFQEALGFLSNECRQRDPLGRGTPIKLEFRPQFGPRALFSGARVTAPEDVKITVTLTNIPLIEALKYVTGLADTKFFIRADGVHVVSVWDPEPMSTRLLAIPPDFFSAHEEQDRIDHTDRVTQIKKDFRGYLVANGADFPEGTAAVLNDAATRLTVHANIYEFPRVQHILETERPPVAWPAPRPEVPKVIEGWSLEQDLDRSRSEANVAKKTHSLILPKVEFDRVNIFEAAKILHEMSIHADIRSPEPARGVEISAISPGESPDDRDPTIVSYSATRVSLFAALEAIARLSHRYVRIEDNVVRLEKKSPDERIVRRTYLVPPQMPTNLELAQPSAPENQQATPPKLAGAAVEAEPMISKSNSWKTRTVVALDTVGNLRPLTEQLEKAWREYYAAEKAKKGKPR